MATLRKSGADPISKEGKDRIRSAYWRHGEEAIEAKANRSAKIIILRYLTEIGNRCEIFYKDIRALDQPPLGCERLDIKDPEQLTIAIIRTLPKQ